MNNNLRRILIEYILATRNEINIDVHLYKLSDLQPRELGYLPRPSKGLGFGKVGVFFFYLLRYFWRYGAAYFFFYLEWLRLRGKVRKNGAFPSLNFDVFGLAFSYRVADLASSSIKGQSFCWLTVPWISFELGEDRAISLFEFLDKDDLRRAFILSCMAVRKLTILRKTRNWELQGYTAFRWFCVRFALDKLPASYFLIGEHFDRWAVLVDAVVSAKRRNKSVTNSDNGIIMLQHGSLASLGECNSVEETDFPISLPVRLRNVVKLYVFDDASRFIFRRYIFSKLCALRDESVVIYKPRLNLTHFKHTRPVNILFVGHPLCESAHVDIFRGLTDEFVVGFYYKPHPVNPCSSKVFKEEWVVIRDKALFPKVDMLISYPSTLVEEYESMGIPGIIHPLNIQPSSVGEVCDSASRLLEALGCERKVDRQGQEFLRKK
ncbi:hypothetical protein ACEPT0_19575 [Pseudomonas paraeruginosa]|uniref:hypothetical protein n=1 Tax=Pseudomonas paraeruginosa TaxID=2994495 RepID=UPI0037487C06